MEHYLKPARTAGGTLVKPWWNPRGWNPRGTFLKPDHPSPRRNCWNSGGTLVEPYLKPPRTTLQPWWNPRGTLPQTTPEHPALAELGGTLVEPWWNPGGTLVEPWSSPGGTLVEPLVEPWWNLSSGSPRTTPEPIWAETPKLSAVGEKKPTSPTFGGVGFPPPPFESLAQNLVFKWS